MCWVSSSIEMNGLPYWILGAALELLDEDLVARPQGDPGCGVGVFWPRVVTQGAVSAPWKCKLLLACTLSSIITG